MAKIAPSQGDTLGEEPWEAHLDFLPLRPIHFLGLNALGKKFPVLLNSTKLQVAFQFVFISTLWLVLSGLWALGFLIFGNESYSKCKQMEKVPAWPSMAHSNAVICWHWLGECSCIKQLCLLSPFQEGSKVAYQGGAQPMPLSGSTWEGLGGAISVQETFE